MLLRRQTAIKLFRPDAVFEETIELFEREGQMTSKLTSPNTIVVYGYGRTPDGIFYYAMEYLDGIDPMRLVQRGGSMPEERMVHILDQICASLAEAHDTGLIHRDIKPSNIMLCERGGVYYFAKVFDFGIVKTLGEENGDAAHNLTGTPH